MKKLLLINPRNYLKSGLLNYEFSNFPPLGLGILATLTPDNWEIEIFDENFDDFQFIEADFVGFTAFTGNAYRAYQIADIYRKKGIPTIMGGIHVSMIPEEAEKFIDTVVTGEAESIWPTVINDFEHNRLQKRYTGIRLKAHQLVPARHDLFHRRYSVDTIQTTRGCPWRCEFCTVHAFNGTVYRQRPVDDVLDELEKTTKPLLFFVDDNLIGYSKRSMQRTIELLKGMKKRGIKKEWFTQASINFSENDEMLQLAHETGCRMVLIGVESEKIESLKETKKDLNQKIGIQNYSNIFKKIHSYGIAVLGTFIFGLDTDSKQDIQNRADFIINSNVDAFQTTVLTPFPGTGTYYKFLRENRIHYTNFPESWQRFRFFENVIEPAKMTHEELTEELFTAWSRIYDPKNLIKKFKMTLTETRDVKTAFLSLITNANYANTIFEGTGYYFDPENMMKTVPHGGVFDKINT